MIQKRVVGDPKKGWRWSKKELMIQKRADDYSKRRNRNSQTFHTSLARRSILIWRTFIWRTIAVAKAKAKEDSNLTHTRCCSTSIVHFRWEKIQCSLVQKLRMPLTLLGGRGRWNTFLRSTQGHAKSKFQHFALSYGVLLDRASGTRDTKLLKVFIQRKFIPDWPCTKFKCMKQYIHFITIWTTDRSRRSMEGLILQGFARSSWRRAGLRYRKRLTKKWQHYHRSKALDAHFVSRISSNHQQPLFNHEPLN